MQRLQKDIKCNTGCYVELSEWCDGYEVYVSDSGGKWQISLNLYHQNWRLGSVNVSIDVARKLYEDLGNALRGFDNDPGPELRITSKPSEQGECPGAVSKGG